MSMAMAMAMTMMIFPAPCSLLPSLIPELTAVAGVVGGVCPIIRIA